MPDSPLRRTRFERFLSLFTQLRPGEGQSVLLFSLYAFLLLVAYYILKTLREPLLLVESTAEMKSYAYATIAVLLLLLIPIYGYVFRRAEKTRLTQGLTLFFVANMAIFYALGRAGVDIGFAYFVWIGIVSLMLTVQFWGYAADTYNLKSGERLFPVIMAGATLGGLIGPLLAGSLYRLIGPWNLMIMVGIILVATVPLVVASRNSVPDGSRNSARPDKPKPHFMGGLAMVMQDRYLLLLAVLMVLLNWVNTTGEYILAEFVVRYAEQQAAADATVLKGDVIATFYSRFYFVVNALTLAIQVFAVARIFRWIGVRGAVMVLPLIALIGYGLIVFVPIFSIIRIAKIAENSTDYSLMNTTRHTLYLPLTSEQKYEGKTAVETFFWRLGDLIQAGVIFVGLHWFNFAPQDFAALNMLLALVWLWVAFKLGGMYQGAAQVNCSNQPPVLQRPLAAHFLEAGQSFSFVLPADAFVDPDPGDVLTISAKLADGSALPKWLNFDEELLHFSGEVPVNKLESTELLLTATDFSGALVSAPLVLNHRRSKNE